MLYLIIGSIAGAVLALLKHYSVSHLLPFLWVGLYGAMFLLALPTARKHSELTFVTILSSFLASMPFVWIDQTLSPMSAITIGLFPLCLLNAYAINAFHIAYHSHRFHMPYVALFHAVWDTSVKILIALLFTLLCWIVLALCAALFSVLQISLFKILFRKSWFIIWSTTFFSAIGLYIATQTQKIVRGFCEIVLIICKYLFPALAVITLLFAATFLLKVLTHNNIVDEALCDVIIWGAFLGIIFFNGVYQFGHENPPYHKTFVWIFTLFLWVMSVFLAIATHRYFSGKLDVNNFAPSISAGLLLVYSLAYAIIALQHKTPWFKSIEKINIVLAFVLILVTFSASNPWVLSKIPNPAQAKSIKK